MPQAQVRMMEGSDGHVGGVNDGGSRGGVLRMRKVCEGNQ